MANFHIVAGASEAPAHPVVRKITTADLKEALAKGFDDFWAMPSHLVFLGLIYPILGVCLAALTFSNNALRNFSGFQEGVHFHANALQQTVTLKMLNKALKVSKWHNE